MQMTKVLTSYEDKLPQPTAPSAIAGCCRALTEATTADTCASAVTTTSGIIVSLLNHSYNFYLILSSTAIRYLPLSSRMPNQLNIPFKKTTDIPIRAAVRKYISEKYQDTHPEALKWDTSQWETLRKDGVGGTVHVDRVPSAQLYVQNALTRRQRHSLNTLPSYHAQLVFILTKLPPDVSLRISHVLAYTQILNGMSGRSASIFPIIPHLTHRDHRLSCATWPMNAPPCSSTSPLSIHNWQQLKIVRALRVSSRL